MQQISYMPLQEGIWFQVLTIAMLEGFGVYFWQYRKLPGALPQVFAQLTKAIWLIAQLGLTYSTVLPWQIFWAKLEDTAGIVLLAVWFWFTQELSRPERVVPKWLMPIVVACTAGLSLMCLTNEWHLWYWHSLWLNEGRLYAQEMPLVRAAEYFSKIMPIITVGLGIRWLLRTAGLRRRQAITFVLMPSVSYLGYLLKGLLGLPIPTLALGFFLSGIYIIWAYRRWLVYQIMPQAQHLVVQDMSEGLVVVDEQGYIVEVNPAGRRTLSGLPIVNGAPFSAVLGGWPALGEALTLASGAAVEISRLQDSGISHYLVTRATLENPAHDSLGFILLFKDITQQKQDQAQLLQQEKALSIVAERNRLGREIHDSSGQVWNFLRLELQVLRSTLLKGRVDDGLQQVDRLLALTQELNTDVRETIVGLKQTKSGDFLSTLQEYVIWYQQTHGIPVQLSVQEIEDSVCLQEGEAVQLLRIVQEALTNIRKHAQASAVEIRLVQQADAVVVWIKDNGCGFEPAAVQGKQGYGLQIMQERAAEAGATWEIRSTPGQGTVVKVRFSRP